MILVVLVAFLAGMEGILDEFQFPSTTSGMYINWLSYWEPSRLYYLGGTLQMIALGWANIGAAVAPDAALASVASAIILVLGGQGVKAVSSAIAIAVPLAVAGLLLTMICTYNRSCQFVHLMDAAAKEGNFRKVELWHIIAICLQGVRIAIPAGLILAIGEGPVKLP